MKEVVCGRAAIRGWLLACALLLIAGQASATRAHGENPARVPASQAYAKEAEIPGAEPIGTEACAGCHADAMQGFRSSVHNDARVGCEDCHGAGSLHAADDTTHGHIHRFKDEGAEGANGSCLRCHADESALHGWRSARHARESVRCVDCHTIHALKAARDLRQARNEVCARCHGREVAEGGLPYHHPVRENRMVCVDCHDPHGGHGDASLRTSQVNDLCFQCHAEYQGPFTYQHPPVTESCLKCHVAHGSLNASLLVVSQPMLCLQCHPGHHNESGKPLLNPCTNCHASIHGTDTPSATGGSVFIDK